MSEILDRTGEININNQGTEMKIIAYRNSSDMDVEFLDTHHYVKTNVPYINFKRGCVSNPYDRTVFGIGYLGERKDKAVVKHDDDRYACWQHMIERCYLEKKKDIHPSYYGISEVSEEWQCYANFASWYDYHYYEVNERLHLDKDILYKGNKIYSPHHCIFVPQRINLQFGKSGINGKEKVVDKNKIVNMLDDYPTMPDYVKFAIIRRVS